MQKILFLLLLALVMAVTAFAQGSDDYHRIEVYGGYSYARQAPNSGAQTVTEPPDVFTFEPCTADGAAALGSNFQRIFCDRRGFHGFDTSFTYNISKYVGIKGNVTGHFKTDTVADNFGAGRVDTNKLTDRTYNYLAGVQIKNNSKTGRFKPFLHALAGVARQTSHDVQTSTAGFNFTLDDRVTSFAMKLGGGLDVRLNRHVDLRLVEVNYNPIFARDRDVPGNADFELRLAGKTAHNFTIGFGIAIH
jgi:opacity protein-like surface antigen